ncbi:MAG: 5-(carboxyamino)imidazole ribonucleotide synthase [Lactobacillaceae bacterium]|jgi:5-(carboxyamino)imidazole ribonucleotide synthase|nr:5-(carboxyamino)imidazole ribonucleotide synthase [Lactobacillaceae bacterium]
MNKIILPPATIGIVGGGQLGRMIALAAKPMGYRVGVLDPTPDCPAGQIADFQITAGYDDEAALLNLARQSDVLTYEFENVDLNTLQEASKITALPQGTDLLHITKNRLREKQFLADNGIPVTTFAEVESVVSLDAKVAEVGCPAILKTAEGGYDGHGQWDIDSQETLSALIARWPVPENVQLILEKQISFDRELSVMVTRDGLDQVHVWPVAENVHANHILKTTHAPANISATLKAEIFQIATQIAEHLDLRGVLGVEMFVAGDAVYVNELAPRPHNSGHYTIEGTNVSQFEGHVRSICGLPIDEIKAVDTALMLNLLGDELTQARQDLVNQPAWHFHDYGKADIKRDRKMGHITAVGKKSIQALLNWSKNHEQG